VHERIELAEVGQTALGCALVIVNTGRSQTKSKACKGQMALARANSGEAGQLMCLLAASTYE